MKFVQKKYKNENQHISIKIIVAILMIANFSSCATVFGGHVTACQRTKPAAGEPSRSIRVVAMVADILLFVPGLVVDFATGAIYKPCATVAVK